MKMVFSWDDQSPVAGWGGKCPVRWEKPGSGTKAHWHLWSVSNACIPPANIPVPVCPKPAPSASQNLLLNIPNLLSQEDSWVRSYVFEQPRVGGVLVPKMLAENTVPNDSLWEGVEHADPEQAAARTAMSLEKIILVFSKPLGFDWTQTVPKIDGTRSTSAGN